jgi:hypothetical protein
MSVAHVHGARYVSEFRRQTGLLFIPEVTYVCEESSWNEIVYGNPKNLEKTYPSAALYITNTSWAEAGANPGLSGER